MATSRKPDTVMTLHLTTADDPIPTRRVDIFYTTSMPWEAQ